MTPTNNLTEHCREFLRSQFSLNTYGDVDATTAIKTYGALAIQNASDPEMAANLMKFAYEAMEAMVHYAAVGTELESVVGKPRTADASSIKNLKTFLEGAKRVFASVPEAQEDLNSMLATYNRCFGNSLDKSR